MTTDRKYDDVKRALHGGLKLSPCSQWLYDLISVCMKGQQKKNPSCSSTDNVAHTAVSSSELEQSSPPPLVASMGGPSDIDSALSDHPSQPSLDPYDTSVLVGHQTRQSIKPNHQTDKVESARVLQLRQVIGRDFWLWNRQTKISHWLMFPFSFWQKQWLVWQVNRPLWKNKSLASS